MADQADQGPDWEELNLPVTCRQRPASELPPDQFFDSAEGYRRGDVLFCKADETVYACVDDSVGAARWLPYYQTLTPDPTQLRKRVQAFLDKHDREVVESQEGWDDPLFDEEE